MSRLMRSGGFAPAHALVIESDETYCALCDRDARSGWVHVATQLLVCIQCMSDPEARDGEAGRRVSERVVAVAEAPMIW